MPRPLFVLASTLVLLVAACGAGADPGDVPPLPETTAEEIQALLDSSPQPVVLNIWAAWCIPCRSEAPLLRRAHEQFGDEIRFIGVDVRDNQTSARAFINEFGLEFENYFDPAGEVPIALRGRGVPVTFFFGPGGDLSKLHPGVIDERQLALQIDELLIQAR